MSPVSDTAAPGGSGRRWRAPAPWERSEAVLVCEDGAVWRGASMGATGTAFGEVVFNTAMAGYQEVLTDPSYHRQLVAMTASHVGNTGWVPDDDESGAVQVAGFILRSVSRVRSNHRSRRDLEEVLGDAGVVGITEVDTRRLTRHLRDAGALRGAISTDVADVDALVDRIRSQPEMAGSELASEVTTTERYELAATGSPRFRVVVVDFGLKANQLRMLREIGCDLIVVPASATPDDVLAVAPDGVFLSNGPGDPAAVRHGVATAAAVVAAGVPTFGICLGHQLLALALGARTYKLAFGHHGVNHPIRNLRRNTIEIASHNHGFAVDVDSLPGADGPLGAVEATHVNLNDGTNAGIRAVDRPAFSVQYHPESAPGPHDSRYLFAEFAQLMEAAR